MRRVLTFATFGRELRCASTGPSGVTESAFSRPATHFDVPSMAGRLVGRERLVDGLWQQLLSGQRIHSVEGPDGLGKSSVAALFCDRCKSSNRFSCIQWIDARHSPLVQLQSFLGGMSGREESDVLFVMDDVTNLRNVLGSLPKHSRCHFILTSSESSDVGRSEINVVQLSPLLPHLSTQIIGDVTDAQQSLRISTSLAHVPLLVDMATRLLGAGAISASQIDECSQAAIKNGEFSITACLEGLVELALRHLSSANLDTRVDVSLGALSCFNINDLTLPLFDAVDCASLTELACSVGLLQQKWNSDGFTMQPLVAKVLRKRVNLEQAADALTGMWPRRMSGRGNAACASLVWHTVFLRSSFQERNLSLSPALRICMDKAANYLAILEGRDLPIASDLWFSIHKIHVSEGTVSETSVRIAKDLGRTLYRCQRFAESAEVLETALRWSEALVGDGAVSHSLLLSSYAPFLPSDEHSLQRLSQANDVLSQALAMPDVSYSTEERRMMTESLIGVLLCAAQIRVDIGQEVTPSMRADIEKWKGQLAPHKK